MGIIMDKFELVEIFKDTVDFGISFNNSITTKHTFRDIKIVEPTDYKDNIKVVNIDSVSAIIEYSKLGKTCVLNMASYKRPGGGVANGARAQEECLFRCSNLYHTIGANLYPIIENQCIYTKDAVFFKDVNYNYIDSVVSDVITIAAINLNENSLYNTNTDISEYEKINKNKIRLMLSKAIDNQVENIILGAWGCGVFNNNPEIISFYFYDVLVNEGYAAYFKNVIFAIINDHNSVGNNFYSFNEQFS